MVGAGGLEPKWSSSIALTARVRRCLNEIAPPRQLKKRVR
jgi:hypothetical protein